RDCWVLKYDLKGFFMSINRQKVTDKLCRFIEERYDGEDKPTLLYLCRQVLLNAPEKNCIIKGKRSEWNGLSADKSLFTVPDGYGLPIGNLTSQLIANFLLNDADHYLKEELGLSIVRYVDDTATVGCDKAAMLAAMPIIREYLWESAGARVHPKKFYMQHYTKGVSFIGAVIKRERIYLANRSLGSAYKRLHKFNELAAENPDFAKRNVEYFVQCINSYLGLTRHFNAYALRRDLIDAISPEWRKVVYPDKDFTKLIIKKRFKHRERIKFALRKQRRKAKRNIT
ncbi:MAG: RNA-directed DNA polymerase, partial [Alistipes sp.]|nr:RNA-directed DNA polymerase [Alistipes sp.]